MRRITACALFLLLASCSSCEKEENTGKPKVAVSIFPIYDIARRVAGDDLEVVLVLPPGRSEHSYDPTPREVAALSGSAMSVGVGLEMDSWLTRIVNTAAGDDVHEVLLAPQLEPRRMSAREVGTFDADDDEAEEHGDEEEHAEDEEHAGDEHADEHEEHAHGEHEEGEHEEAEASGHEHEHEHEQGEHEEGEHEHEEGEHAEPAHEEHAHHHHHGGLDPHFWLDPVRMEQVVDILVREFGVLVPAAREGLAARGDQVKSDLAGLHEDINTASEAWTKRTIVTFHGSFGYFAERYNLTIAAVVEPFPGREPTPRYMSDVLGALRGAEVAALFSEPQLDPRPAQVIAQESNVPLYQLDPVGGSTGRESYEALMRVNLGAFNHALR